VPYSKEHMLSVLSLCEEERTGLLRTAGRPCWEAQ